MNNRKPAFLVMCAAEGLRACLAFSSFLPMIQRDASRAAMLGAVLASPQLLLPLAWYYLWRDEIRNSGMKGLVLAGKSLSVLAGLGWAATFLIGLGAGKDPVDAKIIGAASFWGLITLMDVSLAVATFVLSRGIIGEEG